MNELELVKKELEKHRGKGNTISAGEIAEMLGYSVEGSHAKGRDLVKRCAKKHKIPVGETLQLLHNYNSRRIGGI